MFLNKLYNSLLVGLSDKFARRYKHSLKEKKITFCNDANSIEKIKRNVTRFKCKSSNNKV